MQKLQVPVVVAVIKNPENKILIARRNDPHIPDAHNKWELVGGKLEYGEDIEKCLEREVKEETGLSILKQRLLPHIPQMIWKKGDGSELQAILISYECLVGHEDPVTNDPKISELKYIEQSQLDEYDFLPLDKEIIQLSFKE